MTTEPLEEVLESPRCACGGRKRIQRLFCLDCFEALPPLSRKFIRYLCASDDQGAYDAALEYLQRNVYVNQSPA